MATAHRKPGGRPLRRKVATRQPRRTFLIFCEGIRTEPEYLNALKRQPWLRDTASVDIRIVPSRSGSLPRTLVSMAIGARAKATEESGEIDEFWCVFDVEWPRNHPGLGEAIAEAERNGIQVAVSNPCFELWLILHFRDQTAWLHNEDAGRLRRALDGSDDKGLDPQKYMPYVDDAVHRAAKLDEQHERNRTRFPDNNPSSGMRHLVAAIRPRQQRAGNASAARGRR